MPVVKMPKPKQKHPSFSTDALGLMKEIEHWIDAREYLGLDPETLQKTMRLLNRYIDLAGNQEIPNDSDD